MYYTLAGVIVPILVIGARSASNEGTRKGTVVSLIGYALSFGIYALGLVF